MKWILVVVWMAAPSTPDKSAYSEMSGHFNSVAECLAEAAKWTGVESPSIGHVLVKISCGAVVDTP